MQPLLILHGAIGAKEQLQPLSQILSDKYIVHTINFSGHGNEPMPDKFSIEQFANDVINYMNKNNIASANIFGYSMGGYVALYLAKHFPEKVNKVFTFATKFLWTPEIAQKEIKMLNPEKIVEKIPAFAQQLLERHKPNDWKEVLSKTSAMMIDLGNNNCLQTNDYSSIKQHVLIGIGDKDNMVTLDETIAVYKNLPNANLFVMPFTQHPIEKVNNNILSQQISAFFM